MSRRYDAHDLACTCRDCESKRPPQLPGTSERERALAVVAAIRAERGWPARRRVVDVVDERVTMAS
jgi:hypothetical protein